MGFGEQEGGVGFEGQGGGDRIRGTRISEESREAVRSRKQLTLSWRCHGKQLTLSWRCHGKQLSLGSLTFS